MYKNKEDKMTLSELHNLYNAFYTDYESEMSKDNPNCETIKWYENILDGIDYLISITLA